MAVVNVTSDASVNGYATWGAYGVSKAALDHLGRTWAEELSGTGVRFLTVDPGEMRTVSLTLVLPRDAFTQGVREVSLRISDGAEYSRVIPCRLLGPASKGQ